MSLKVKRGQIKAFLTRFETFIKEFSDNPLNRARLQQRIQQSKKLMANLPDITAELSTSTEKDNEDHESIEFELTEKYMDLLAAADLLTHVTPIASPQLSTVTPNIRTEYSLTRIPKLELRKFDGKIEEWKSFSHWFLHNIHNRSEISDSTRLSYLQDCLTGEAAKTIEGMETIDQNYKEAWELLQLSYNNEEAIIFKHFELLITIPKIKDNSADEIRQLINETLVHVRSMKVLKEPTDSWDTPLLYITISKLDNATKQEWHRRKSNSERRTFEQLIDFLREEAKKNQATSNQEITDTSNQKPKLKPTHGGQHRTKQTLATTMYKECAICKKDGHAISKCEKLLGSPVSQRINLVKSANLCYNCLRPNHRTNECRSSHCRECGKVHHTILHMNKSDFKEGEQNKDSRSSSQSQRFGNVVLLNQGQVVELMVTAVVNILNKDNKPVRCRTLLDTASTSNLITEEFANSLGLKKDKYTVSVTGLGDMETTTSNKITAVIQSRFNDFEKKLDLFTVPIITHKHPLNYIEEKQLKIPNNCNMADPTFNKPGNIDMLIGAGTVLSTIISGQKNISISNGSDLFLQNTKLGWVIGGAITLSTSKTNRNTEKNSSCLVTTTQALKQLTQTWAIEEGPKIKHLSSEEILCETNYKANTTRHKDGRYIVKLPFNQKLSLLGESRGRALSRLKSLENKFKQKPEFKRQYSIVMQEYLNLGHMELSDSPGTEGFYLPHHAVMKETSLTTKLRVVFDGSAKTKTGISLNETMMVGPTLQDNIIDHLMRFRMHMFVITGDIEKMYRQIWVHPQHRKYQKVLWRDSTGIIQDYQLKTVTFGLSSAPFLAIRSLQQLADDEISNYPTGSKILKRDMYVDDLLTGADTIKEAKQIRNEIDQLLKKGGFKIRQWASNSERVLEGLPPEDINQNLQLQANPVLKTLGIHWNSQQDTIVYTLNKLPTEVTMRAILSEIAKIFDPLGLLSPLIIAARLILQDCWRQHITWDQQLPPNIKSNWSSYATEFNKINSISCKRLALLQNSSDNQIHGFADASERAYGACLYLRCADPQGIIHTQLLYAKTKIAPLQNVCLARLELCAALILANIYDAVLEHIQVPISKTTFWSDSTIALHWIHTPPYQLKTFVANRVAQIQEKTKSNRWRHVRSEDNPADALSRGQSPRDFLENVLWQNGPKWLTQNESEWPISIISPPTEDMERKTITCLNICTKQMSLEDSFINNFSSIRSLHRVIACCLRFNPKLRQTGQYTAEELHRSQMRIIKLIQSISFAKEIHNLHHKHEVSENSKLKHLSPFIDADGILRVGGRLSNATISYNQKHPIILPNSHPYTTLLIRKVHLEHFHSGPQTTLYALRRQFWPLNGLNEVKRITHQCIRCKKSNPQTAKYTMGELPKERVNETRPFHHTGVDYCGPFYIKEKKYRNRGKVKVYVAVFVCMAIKAVHLEIVSDLTTDGFIAALKRFIARRGKCITIHSDNGSNFIGANNQLKDLYQQLHSRDHQDKIKRYLADQQIDWKFIPARSPHFGGLWESAVKSFKRHMVRMVGESLFTFEELNTFVVEIEAIINSRPLTPNSTNPNDPIAITPGHFLIGDSLTSIPERDWTNVSLNKLSNWQTMQKLKQAFWKRWHKEYINGLNVRNKWYRGKHEIKEGTIVVIKDDNSHPIRWPLGRVIETHPGPDGIIRTVTIKTSTGIIQRSVRNLAVLLPTETQIKHP